MNEKIRVNNKKSKDKKTNVGVGLVYSNAITLISLVITVVVLIILASVAIYLSLGNDGIFTRAKQAKEATNKQEATEIINLKITTAQMNKYAKKQEMPTLQELADVLYEDNEIQYVTLESKVANKEKIIVGDNTSIFTKLNKYPYEFEINSSLQLASIDGIKMATNTNEISGQTENLRLIEENCSGRYTKEISVFNIEGYENFTEDNFLIILKGIESEYSNDAAEMKQITKSYDNKTGKLTISKCITYHSGNYYQAWAIYDIYLKNM